MAMMNGAQAIVRCFEREQVEVVFGYPGGQAVRLFDALCDSDIRFVLARHEQAAVHEADGYARASGDVGVVMVTSGPGATNTVTGIATAYMDSIPLVVVTGQVPTGVIGTDSFQESDIFGITLPVVKHSYLVRSVQELPGVIKEAFHIARTGRPGPVLVDVPSNVAAAQVEFSYPANVNLPSYKPTIKGNQKQIRAAATCIEHARKPLIIAGGGVVSSGASAQVTMLAEMMQIPVVCTLMGKGTLASSSPLNLGPVGMHGSKFTSCALAECDLLIALGCHFSDRVTGVPHKFAPQAELVHIDIDPAEIGKIFPPKVPIVGDVASVLDDLIETLEKRGAAPNTQEWLEQIAAWRARWPYYDKALPDDPSEIVPEILLGTLSEKIAPLNCIVTTDVGQHQMWANQFVGRELPRTFLTSGGLGTMGFGLPSAIGAAIAHGESMVVCVSGDGSLQMNIQEMATAVACGANVKVLLLDNGVLGMVRQWQGLFYERRYAATTLDANPDFVALAQAFGWQAARVEDPAQIPNALDEMLASTGPYLLDCVVSPDQNVYPMIPPGAGIDECVGAIDLAAGAVREGVKTVRFDGEEEGARL